MKIHALTMMPLLALPLLFGAAVGCGPDKDAKSPAEKTEDAVEKAGDKADEAAEEVGDEIDDHTDDKK
jgi:hypothetical protein